MHYHNEPLALLPSKASAMPELLAAPRPTLRPAAAVGAATGYVEIVGVLEPEYLSEVRRQLLLLAANDSIGRIVLLMDSPGGLVLGTPETAEVVKRVAKRKPVDVIAENYLASAAYYIASQATSITVTPSTLVGSIGAMIVIFDDSGMFEANGVKAFKVSSAPLKGAGAPGVPVEPEHLAMLQRQIDFTAAAFEAAVAAGRRLGRKELDAITTGDVWQGPRAKVLGLVDRVELFEDAIAKFIAAPKASAPFATLTGKAAQQHFNELVIAEAGGPAGDCDAAEKVVAARYPDLASAVYAFEAN